KKRILKLVTIENSDIAKELYKKNKNIIAVTGHYGNWEVFLVLPLLSPHQVLGVYKPLNNKLFDNLLYKMREKFGAVPVTMHNSYKTVLEYKKNNTLILLGLIADQRPHKKEGNYWTTFLNQETNVFLGPEKFAKKLNASVLFLYLEKVKRGKYIFKSSLLFEDILKCTDNEITDTYLKFLEKLIVDKPELYLWSHNRWKLKKEESTF
ncbi:MAG: lysophospholipid acyltransferase family protein, partial [Bacteroidales bacterium]|nr:lysophospholipid acyltransferase family protein [Bacteroidales bacterium]